jgi:hypothetical protein
MGSDTGDVRGHRVRPALREHLFEVRADDLDLAIADQVRVKKSRCRKQIAAPGCRCR